MPKITFGSHEDLCPEGAALEAKLVRWFDVALKAGIGIEHACEKSHVQHVTL